MITMQDDSYACCGCSQPFHPKGHTKHTHGVGMVSTQGLKGSSLLVLTRFLLKDCNTLPKKELPLSPWVQVGFVILALSRCLVFGNSDRQRYRSGHADGTQSLKTMSTMDFRPPNWRGAPYYPLYKPPC